MKKRKIAVILATALAASTMFTACGGNTSSESGESQTAEKSQAAETDEEADISTAEIEKYAPGSRTPEEIAATLPREDAPNVTYESMRGIAVSKGDEVIYEINYTPQEERETFLYWDMITPYGSTAIINTENMQNAFGVLDYLDFSGTEIQKDAKLGDVAATLTLTYTKVEEAQSDDSAEAESTKGAIEPDYGLVLLVGDKTGDGNYCCAYEESPDQVFYMNANYLDSLLNADPYDLILKIPYVLSYSAVKQVAITYEGKTKKIYYNAKQDLYHFGHTLVDDTVYKDFYSELMQPMIVGQIEEDKVLEAGREPVLTLNYVRNYEGAEDFTVNIYADGAHKYTIDVNGEENFYIDPDEVKTLLKVVEQHFEEY